ncbi:MAG: desulfoferrodoxin family protein [Tissierellia bacterium]|nr:desulfoferrodoxin family protein [Tissierellia bacterium]
MCNVKFFRCNLCGNLVGMIHESGVKLVCCGQEMEELVANTVDAAYEKHIPVVEVDGNIVTVTVGSTIHPMVEEHYIQWIYLVTKEGAQRKCLQPGQEPVAKFALTEGDEVVAAYEYCNLHGLWKKEM